MARLERFKEAVHPDTHITPVGFNEAVGRMIRRTVVAIEPANLAWTGQPLQIKDDDTTPSSG